jgi:hypothetical protein
MTGYCGGLMLMIVAFPTSLQRTPRFDPVVEIGSGIIGLIVAIRIAVPVCRIDPFVEKPEPRNRWRWVMLGSIMFLLILLEVFLTL